MSHNRFPCPAIRSEFPKIGNAPRDACKLPFYYLIISTNKYVGHPDQPCTSYQKPAGKLTMAPAKNRPAKLIQAFALPGDDASPRATRLKYPLRILYNVASALPHGNPQASDLQESAALRTRMTRLLAHITERSQYGFL